jgi:hypothetical protein
VPDIDDVVAGLALVPASHPAALAVDADLRLEVTTSAGTSSTARVTGHGRELRVVAQQPEALLSAMAWADVGRVADLLASVGVTVAVDGPRGLVATLGADASSRFGRAVTGSNRVAPDPLGTLRVVMAGGPARTAAFALPGVLALLGLVGLLRRKVGSRR